jgi:dihydropteroate synthase
VSGLLYDPDLARVAASSGAGMVLMHTRGRSANMYAEAVYGDVLGEVAAELAASIERACNAGVPREAIIVDPGVGFAKRSEHSFEVLARLADPALLALDRPILVGPSRKSFLTRAVGDRPPRDREWGTAAAVTAAVLGGAHIVRVHGVSEMVQAVSVADTIRAHAHRDSPA